LKAQIQSEQSLENKDQFEMTYVCEDVREILETTGFDVFFPDE